MWIMSIKHKGTVSIETSRLLLRRFEEKDTKDMFERWAADPEVTKYISWGPHKDMETSRQRILSWLEGYKRNNSYVWAIEFKRNGAAIGSISVELADDKSESCEVGYCLSKEYWSCGIMTEALLAVMHFLFYEVGYRRIRAKHDNLNIASGRVMQKAGMKYIKLESRVGIRKDGSYYDCAVYEKTREEIG
jgi:ribosomal-protein-alanine N-acetyltransferase